MKRIPVLKYLLLAAMCLLLIGFVAACDTDGGTSSGGTSSGGGTSDCPAGAICRNDEAPGAYSKNGPYKHDTYSLPRAATPADTTVYYPTTAVAPFSGIVYCPPLTGTQPMLAAWGPFMASHGIVLVTMATRTTSDAVASRATQQKQVLDALKAENSRSGSPLNGKLDLSRIGAMGWSMGGGATWINAAEYSGLKAAMTLAGHNATAGTNSKGRGIKCPTLIMNGATDTSILGGMGQSPGVYSNIPSGIPKAIYEVRGIGHFGWTSPTAAGNAAAEIALAFQKAFLDGDTRWAKFIVKPSNAATWESANIPN